jgi:alpha-tubulin suppressor-like RCC1 family protein
MSEKYSTGLIFYSDLSHSGEIKEAIHLYGHRIIAICQLGERGYALTDLNTFDIETGQPLNIFQSKSIQNGKKHSIALTTTGLLYSWGRGEYGELGHGAKSIETNIPTLIQHEKKFIQISCGDYHTFAIDKKGNMFGWGQNFDRQLGLYNKTQTDLPENAIIEELTMRPKFIPFSLLNPIRSVSCGSKFTVVVTQVTIP